jgi:hypothetical protein
MNTTDKIVRISILFLMIAAFLSGCGYGEKQVMLAYRFNSDKIYHFLYDGKTSSTMYENGALVYSGDRIHRIEYSQQVLEIVDSTSGRLLYTYNLMNNDQAVGTAAYRTGSDTWQTEFLMESNGKIIEFSSGENSSENSLDYYRNLFEQASPMYPDGPVTVGYIWHHTVKVITDRGATDASTTYKVKSLVREAGYDCAVIEYWGNMIIPIDSNLAGGTSRINSGSDKIEVEGTVYFAYTEGIIIREEGNSNLVRQGILIAGGESTEFRIEDRRSYTSMLKNIEQK